MNTIDKAVSLFPLVFGEKLRARREAIDAQLADPAGIRASMEPASVTAPEPFDTVGPMPEIAAQMMSLSAVSEMLTGIGVALSADDLAAIEAGIYPNVDARLMLTLMFLLEFSVDAVLLDCLQTATGSENKS